MAHTFDFDLTNDILRCRLIGPVDDEALHDFFRAGAEHAVRIRPGAGVVDLSEVTSFEASAGALMQVAESKPVLPDANLRRIVIAPAPETYGMMRMFEIHGEDKRPNLHVVHTEGEAWAILGVVNPNFEPIENP